MRERRPSSFELLDRYFQTEKRRIPLSLSDREIEHLFESGLATIAHHVIDPDTGSISQQSIRLLQSASLTARVLYGELRETTLELLDIARHNDIPVVLLKGIAIADVLYDEPHHRIMGDIDILVPVSEAPRLFQLLLDTGYYISHRTKERALPEGHHHLPEIRHPEYDVPVEIHTSLFSSNPLANERLFAIPSIWANTEAELFNGDPCLKLRAEFQLLYTVAHWAIDQKWAVNVLSINDIVLMLGRNSQTMDWALVDAWLTESPQLAEYFSIIILFLEENDLIKIPNAISERVRNTACRIGTINTKILHWLIRRFPLAEVQRGWSNITLVMVRVFWGAMLQPRHRFLRPFVSVIYIIFRRTQGRSFIRSIAGRIQTIVKLVTEP